MQTPQEASKVADFVILCALREELDALLKHLPGSIKLEKEEGDQDTFYYAELQTQRQDKTTYRIVASCLKGMGPTSTANKVPSLVKWKPKAIILVGCAGGMPGEVQLGDVIIANQIIDYTLSKFREEKLATIEQEFRFSGYQVDANLLDTAINLDDTWRERVKISRPKRGSKPIVQFGPILSGPSVIDSLTKMKELQKVYPKMVGVEMEGGGLAAALNEQPAVSRPGLFMVRGVSDLASNKGHRKNKVWRGYSYDVAAAYAIALLTEGPVVGPKVQDPQTSKDDVSTKLNTDSNLAALNQGLANISHELSKTLREEFKQLKRSDLHAAIESKISESLVEIINKAEKENPGLIFEVNANAAQATYLVKARPGFPQQDIGQLVFNRNTEAGRRGLEKFEFFLDEGLPVKFEKDECIFDSVLNLPWYKSDQARGTLELRPETPDVNEPVSIEVTQIGQKRLSVKLAYLRIKRVGRKITECCLTGGQLSGEINIVKHYDDSRESSNISYAMIWGSASAKHALLSVDLLLMLHKSASIRVESAVHGILLSGVTSSNVPSGPDEKHLSNIKYLLEHINRINQEFKIDLRFPEYLSDEEAAKIEIIGTALQGGLVSRADIPGRMQLSLKRPAVGNFLSYWKNSQYPNLFIEYSGLIWPIIDQKIRLDKAKVTFFDFRPITPLSVIQTEFNSSDIDIDIEFSYSGTEYEFPAWKKRKRAKLPFANRYLLREAMSFRHTKSTES